MGQMLREVNLFVFYGQMRIGLPTLLVNSEKKGEKKSVFKKKKSEKKRVMSHCFSKGKSYVLTW